MSREPAVRRDVPSDGRRNARRSDRHHSRRSLLQPEQVSSQVSSVDSASIQPANASHRIDPNIDSNNSSPQSNWRDRLKLTLWRSVRHPATLLTVSWIVCVGVAAIAAHQMIKVNPIALQNNVQSQIDGTSASPSPQFRGKESPRRAIARENNGDDLPLASLVAVAISCAAGSFILCHRSPRKPDRRLHLSTRHRSTTGSLTAATAPPTPPSAPPAPSVEVPTPVRATLVPDGESNPLDWDEPSLADHLDLRQHRPLSHWL